MTRHPSRSLSHSGFFAQPSRRVGAASAMAAGLALALAAPARAGEARAAFRQIEDLKAVLATVEPVRQIVARARLGGVVAVLKAREGDELAAGAEIAVIADQKLALQAQALAQRIRSQEAQRAQAKTDFDRVAELQRRGVSAQAQVDQARTALDVADRTLAAMRADLKVLEQQTAEGTVIAPAAGRVLSVPVTEGRAVMPGETIATLAEDKYILRLSLPERHARFLRAGDAVAIAGRDDAATSQQGRVRLVYPEIQGGRVVADVEVPQVGGYFVGERTRVYVPTGARTALFVPSQALHARAGAWFVTLKDGVEVVVQPGDKRGDETEILSGLREGDVVRTPEAAK
jgi:RND family efflux transporter MFP subunit